MDSVDDYLAASECYQTHESCETAPRAQPRIVCRTRVLQASAAQEWQVEPLGVAHRPFLEIAPKNSYSERSRAGTHQFVTAPREADETRSAYLAITPEA